MLFGHFSEDADGQEVAIDRSVVRAHACAGLGLTRLTTLTS